MKHDDLSERLQQHANWLYGIGTPPTPMVAADFLAAGARINRLQAELDIARAQLLSNERGDDRRHYVCVCPDCTKPVDLVSNADPGDLTVAYLAGFHAGRRAKEKPKPLSEQQILRHVGDRKPARLHHGAAVFEYRLFDLINFARGIEQDHRIEETPHAP
jgi:hypothetical protein